MERITRILKLIFRNLYYYRVDYIRNFAIVRLVQAFIILPLISLIIAGIMHVAGVQAITEDSILYLLKNPFAVFGLAIILLIAIVFVYYELGFLILLAYYQQRAIPYTWRALWKRLNQKLVYFISFQTLMIGGYLLLMVPLISAILPISLLQNVAVPSFIVDELLNSTEGTILYITLLLGFGFVGLRLIFTWPFFTIYSTMSIFGAMKMSWQFSGRRLLEVAGMIGLIIVINGMLLFMTLAIVFTPLLVIEKLMPSWGLAAASMTLTLAQGTILLFLMIMQIIFSQLLVMVAFQLTRHKPLIVQEESFRQTIRKWIIVIASISFIIVSIANYFNLKATIYEPDTAVIAHRGFMDEGVENTITAIEAAHETGAEIVEIDIQQTKDGEFVVFHDKSLSRLADEKDIIYDLTLDELIVTPVLADGRVDTIASLEQVLEISRDLNIKLLIEMKTHGFETNDFLQRFVEQLDRFNALDHHYVQSPDLPTMELLEELEPRIHTGYVYSIAYGKLPDTTADFIAVEQSFATENIQEQVQKQGKELFVWTINDKREMQRFYERNVDGVITDHPDEALSIRDEFDEEQNFIQRVLNKIDILY